MNILEEGAWQKAVLAIVSAYRVSNECPDLSDQEQIYLAIDTLDGWIGIIERNSLKYTMRIEDD